METPEIRNSPPETTPNKTQRRALGVSRLIRNAALGILIATGTGACTSTDVNKFLQPDSTPAQAAETMPPDSEVQVEPRLKYDQAAEDRQAQRIKEGTKNLDQTDLEARNSIIEKIKNNPDSDGFAIINDSVAVQYVHVEGQKDKFDIQILTPDVNFAKIQAEQWFVAQGISPNGIFGIGLNFIAPEALPDGTAFSSEPIPLPPTVNP